MTAPGGGGARTLLRILWTRLPHRTAAALALTAAVTATEGVGVLLLLPLLKLVGVAQSGGAGWVERSTEALLAAAGIPAALGPVLALYAAVLTTQALVTRGQSIAVQRLASGTALHLRERLHAAIVRAEWLAVARTRSAELTHLLSAEVDRVAYAAQSLVSLTTGACVAAVYFVLAFQLAPAPTTLALGCAFVLLLLLRAPTRTSRRAGTAYGDAAGGLYTALGEHLGGLKTARSHGAEDRHAAGFHAIAVRLGEAEVAAIRSYADARSAFLAGSAVLLAATVYAGVEVFHLAPATLLLLLFIFGRVLPRVSAMQQQWQQIVHALPAVERVEAAASSFEAAAESRSARARPAPRLEEAVRLEDVTFLYAGDGGGGVRGVNLEVRAGEVTCLVGPSGAGKTTVVDLLVGLLWPQSGAVRVDGTVLEPEMLASWRARIGYVGQETVLLDGTVLDNLLWARPDASEAEVQAALAAAAADFVFALPMGVHTPVGERGVRLSGGERQRIALARALVRRPRLLILDEATSALDAENERRIVETVRALGGSMAVLVVSHRPALPEGASAIYRIQNGRVAAVRRAVEPAGVA
jgi:ATP-binding cassette, subfamily C, bacterial